MTYAIKCRMHGEKTFGFLTSSGGVNKLRIHAGRFATMERAQAVIDDNANDNPEWDFKVVELVSERA
jgi:hypothetical protein